MRVLDAIPLEHLGDQTRAYVMEALQSLAVLGTVLVMALRPHSWPRTVRDVFARQLLFTGFGALKFAIVLAALAGILVVVQANLWLGRVGLSAVSAPLLVGVVARELGPILACLLVIVNSGSAMVTELGLMKIRGEVRVLEAQGIDPLPYLVMPRVLAAGVSSLCLTLVVIGGAFASGFIFEALLIGVRRDATTFAYDVLAALRPADVITISIKGLLPGLFTGAICTTGGLNVGMSASAVPRACRRVLVRSVAALFLITAVTSILMYL